MGGEVEGDRKTFLAGGEVTAIERVGIFRRGEAGILPDGPGLVDIHGRVGAAQIGRDAGPGLEEIYAFEIGLVVAGFYRDALGRQPWLGVAGGRGGGGFFKCDIGEVRNAAHGLHYIMRDPSWSLPQSWSGCWWLTMVAIFSGP